MASTQDAQYWDINTSPWARSARVSDNGRVTVERWRRDGRDFCVKTGSGIGREMLEAEAAGLELIAGAGGVVTPRLLFQDAGLLIMEWIEPVTPRAEYWQTLGRNLATLHAATHHAFGLHRDGFCGNSRQDNRWCDDGFEFFASRRLEPQLRMARDAGLLSREEGEAVMRLARRLPELVPARPPAPVHGDLWSGNVLFGRDGPWVIDPAAHYGWAEADLAMTHLFGGFDAAFYTAYENASALTPGFAGRRDIYNCYHLLNHLNLFGSGYHASLMRIVNRFASK